MDWYYLENPEKLPQLFETQNNMERRLGILHHIIRHGSGKQIRLMFNAIPPYHQREAYLIAYESPHTTHHLLQWCHEQPEGKKTWRTYRHLISNLSAHDAYKKASSLGCDTCGKHDAAQLSGSDSEDDELMTSDGTSEGTSDDTSEDPSDGEGAQVLSGRMLRGKMLLGDDSDTE